MPDSEWYLSLRAPAASMPVRAKVCPCRCTRCHISVALMTLRRTRFSLPDGVAVFDGAGLVVEAPVELAHVSDQFDAHLAVRAALAEDHRVVRHEPSGRHQPPVELPRMCGASGEAPAAGAQDGQGPRVLALGEREQREHPVPGGDEHVIAFGHARQQRVRPSVLHRVAVRVRHGHLVAARCHPESRVAPGVDGPQPDPVPGAGPEDRRRLREAAVDQVVRVVDVPALALCNMRLCPSTAAGVTPASGHRAGAGAGGRHPAGHHR